MPSYKLLGHSPKGLFLSAANFVHQLKIEGKVAVPLVEVHVNLHPGPIGNSRPAQCRAFYLQGGLQKHIEVHVQVEQTLMQCLKDQASAAQDFYISLEQVRSYEKAVLSPHVMPDAQQEWTVTPEIKALSSLLLHSTPAQDA